MFVSFCIYARQGKQTKRRTNRTDNRSYTVIKRENLQNEEGQKDVSDKE